MQKKSGFPVQPNDKSRKNRVFWSTYKESSYHTFGNSVVCHIRCLPRNLNRIYSFQMVKRSMGEPFWKLKRADSACLANKLHDFSGMHYLSGKFCYDNFFRKTHARLYVKEITFLDRCVYLAMQWIVRLAKLAVSIVDSILTQNQIIDAAVSLK